MAETKTGADPGDPYASHKANLRDTIKWLAGVFAALAAVVVAGTPLSGIGALPWAGPRFLVAALALACAFASICAALVLTLRLLRSDVLYPSDLDPDAPLPPGQEGVEIDRLRTLIAAKQGDLFPPEHPSMRQLLARIRELQKEAAATDDDASLASYATAIDDLVGYQRRAIAFAVYQRFYDRLRSAVPWLIGLGSIALVALLVFGLATKSEARVATAPAFVVTLSADPAPVRIVEPSALPALRPVLFATGSADIAPDGYAAVEAARDALAAIPAAGLLLLAHTDTVAPARVNAVLAKRRAAAVRAALVERGGVAPTRVFIAELPEAGLPALTADETDDARNRVVTLLLFARAAR
jgi:outer membrane protein OmpA-like peptidoglycan-associated protein